MDRRIGILVDVEARGLNEVKGLKAALTDVGKAGKTGGEGLEKAAKGGTSLNTSIKDLVGKGLLAGAAVGLVKFGATAINAASNVEEMQSKFNTVFKDLAGDVTAELETFADAANRSTYDLQGFAATLQDTFVPLGFARDSAADMSIQLVKLAEDLASFNNLDSAMVVEDLQSALVGNTETLRKYGVVATQAAIDQEALALGLEFTKGKMDAQTKAAAILSITMKSTSDAQGDAIRTADSYANQLKGLQAAQQELNVELGQVFLPTAVSVVSALTDFVKGGAEGVAAIREMTGAAAQLGEEQRALAEETGSYNEYGRKLATTLESNTDLVSKLFGGFKFVRGEIEKTAAAAGDFSGTNDDLAASLSDVFGGTVKIEGGLVSLNGEIVSEVAVLEQLNAEYRKHQALLASQEAITSGAAAAAAEYDRKLIGLTNTALDAAQASKNLANADLDGVDAAAMYGEANRTTAAQIHEAELAETRRALATEASISANERLVGAFQNTAGQVDTLIDASNNVKGANEELVASYQNLALEGSLALAELSPDPAALQRALDYAVSIGAMTEEAAGLRLQAANTQLALGDLNQLVIDGAITSETAASAFGLITAGQARTAEQAIITAENVQNLHGELDGIAGTYEASVNVDTGDAEARLLRLQGLINSVSLGQTAVTSAVGSQLAAAAAGGIPRADNNFASGVSDFVVPPGYPNDSYMVGLTSGETVNVTPANQTTNNSNSVGNIYIYANGLDVAAQAQKGVGDALRELGIKGF